MPKVSSAEVVLRMAAAAIAEAQSELPWHAARMTTSSGAASRIEARALEILGEWFQLCEAQVRDQERERARDLKTGPLPLKPGELERCVLEMLEGSSWRFVAAHDIRTEWGTVVRAGGGFTVRALPSGPVSEEQHVVMTCEEGSDGQPVGFTLSEASYWERLGFRRERVWPVPQLP